MTPIPPLPPEDEIEDDLVDDPDDVDEDDEETDDDEDLVDEDEDPDEIEPRIGSARMLTTPVAPSPQSTGGAGQLWLINTRSFRPKNQSRHRKALPISISSIEIAAVKDCVGSVEDRRLRGMRSVHYADYGYDQRRIHAPAGS